MNNLIHKKNAFTIIEISIVILIIGILIAGISNGLDLYQDYRFTSARQLTNNSIVGRINGLTLWFETTSEKSFENAHPLGNEPIAKWKNLNYQTSNSVHVFQSDSQFQPKYLDNAINNLPALNFNDGIKYLISDPINYAEISDIENMTLFFVTRSMGTFNNNNPSAFFTFAEKDLNGTEIFRNQLYLFHQNKILFQYGDLCGASVSFIYNTCRATVSLLNPKHPNNNFIVTAVKSQSVGKIYINTLIDTTNSLHSDKYPQTNIKNPIYIGGNTTRSALNYTGELIMFNRTLTDKEIEGVHNYLRSKWKI
jgi:prepilin-type N-terminal cleavage/methylation domain-containing protein